MTTKIKKTEKPFGILGIGAAACAACCAGPILGFAATTGLLTATGLTLFGTVGLLIAIPGTALVVRRRRHRPSTCTPADGPVAVASPARTSRLREGTKSATADSAGARRS